MALVTGQTAVSATAASFVSTVVAPAAVTLINNNSSGAIAFGQSTAVTMSAGSGGALIPAGQQVTFTVPAGAPSFSLYVIGGTAGTLSSIISTSR